jgi:potassium-dependent mechanosensitive channel
LPTSGFRKAEVKIDGELMSANFPLRLSLSCALIFWLAGAGPGPARASSPPPRLEQLATKIISPEILPKVLTGGATTLEGQIKDLQTRLTESQKRLAERQNDLKDIQVEVASLKAALAVGKPSLTRFQELLASYALLNTQAKERGRVLSEDIKTLKQGMTADIVAENTLRIQMGVLQAAGEPTAVSPEMDQALTRYLQLADTRDRLAAQVLDNLDKTGQVLEQEKQLLAGLEPDLRNLEKAWQTELLQRPPARLSAREQLNSLLINLAALPGKGRKWLAAGAASGELRSFFLGHLFHLVGLVAFLVLLGWSTRRLRRLTDRRFEAWRARAADLHLLPLAVVGRSVVASLFLPGLVLWAAVLFWDFGVLGSNPAWFALYLLGAWWALRLALALVSAFFAGKERDGVLPLDEPTARYYRRSLKVFAAYLVLGIFGLQSAPLLNFPEISRIFAEHVFLVGLLILVLWLLRRRWLVQIQPWLPDPHWVRRPAAGRVIKGVVLFLLAITILADLLSLTNLAFYVVQAAAWTFLSILFFWLLWLAGESVIRHLLHPDLGWARRRYPARQELVQRIYQLSSLLVSVILGAAVIFMALNSWGIPAARVAWAFRWVTWGPTLGPVKLTPLNIVAACIALYLGSWLSRLTRSIIALKVFPRTGLDEGVQYTVSTTVHYIFLMLAVLVALNILGFPLTNLALVAGALGVGIGFGLQNIVNNFISGLILLFERPIKVGDMLVIDGQWGTVREIRVRSTLFETAERSILIIPNSELVSHKVLNWTHYGRGINRITLKIGVGYDSEVRLVTQLLTEVCRASERVVKDPAPQIYFEVYGESTLNFTIWVHVRTPDDRVPATHELNSAILATFRQHGIEMPFPQRDLHIKGWPAPPEKA